MGSGGSFDPLKSENVVNPSKARQNPAVVIRMYSRFSGVVYLMDRKQ